MRPAVATTSGASTSSVIPLDNYRSPFNVGFGVVVTGAVVYSVQHTFDDVYAASFNPATATWFTHPSVTGLTVSSDGNYAFPVTAVRVLQASGAGSTRTTFIQAGMPGE